VDVSIVSPEAEVWRGEAEMVVARSPEGEFAILRGHIPFLAALVPGLVKIHLAGGAVERFLVTGGVLEASGSLSDYHVIVLADDAEPVGEISEQEVAERIDEARQRVMARTDEVAEAEMRASLARPELGRD
jgi:F-type H+-transporting ATPase subunit epsilon